jgi:hypothetical protein
MKKPVNALFALLLNLLSNHTFSSAGDQIVISADGTIQQEKQNTITNVNKEPAKNAKVQKNKNNTSKLKERVQTSTITTQQNSGALSPSIGTQPVSTTTADIVFIPDTHEKTFRLQLQAKIPPALAIISTHDGFFLIMDKKYSFQLPDLTQNIAFINGITPIKDPKFLILKFTLSPYIYVTFEQKEKKSYLTFFYRDSASAYIQSPSPALLTLDEKTWPTIHVKPIPSNSSVAHITLNNNTYYVLMTPAPDGGYQHYYKTPYYQTVTTQQGFAIQNFSNKTQFSTKDKLLQISHPVTTSPLKSAENASHFQNIFDVNPNRNLSQERSSLMIEKNKLTSPYSLNKLLQWAWINLALNLGQEAKTYLQTAAIHYPKAIHTPLHKALLGMAHFLNHEYKDALDCWKTLPDTFEIIVWKKLAECALGHYDGIDQFIFKINFILEDYPTKLKEALIQHSLKTAENLHNFNAINLLLGPNKSHSSLSMKWINNLYQAKILHEKKDFKRSRKLLKEMHLEENPDQIPVEIASETEFLSILNDLKLNKQNTNEAIRILNDLRLEWRGGSLEYRISQEVINLLVSEKRYADILILLRELKRLFPDRSGVELLNTRMQDFYVKYFQNIQNISPLKIIKTYKDFIDFIPENIQGENIVKIATEQFEKIDLLDEAAELLSRSQSRKPDSSEKVDVLFKIIDIHLSNKKYDEVLAILSTFPQEIATFEQKSKLIMFHTHALLGKKKTAEALVLLNSSTDPKHALFAATIYCQSKQWQKAADKLNSIIPRVDPKKEMHFLTEVINELAIVYFMDNQSEKLNELKKNYEKLMKDQKSFEFLTRTQNHSIKQRSEADAALLEAKYTEDYIKEILEPSQKNGTKNVSGEKLNTKNQNNTPSSEK